MEIRELRRRGVRVDLQQKPFQVLQALLERPGELVSRAQLAKRLWPNLHVEFDGSLNTAVNALRQALRDSSRESRYIETRSGLGYRFIGRVEAVDEREQFSDPRSAEELAETVMAAVAGALHLPPAPNPRSGSRRIETSSREAYQDYLRGRYFLEKLNEQDLVRSVSYFEAALAQDPEYALACCGLADAYCRFAALGTCRGMQVHAKAKEMALRALELDAELAEAHCSLGYVQALLEWDWTGAERQVSQAIALNAECARAHELLADLLLLEGDMRAAQRQNQIAQELDPLSPAVNLQKAWIAYLDGRFQEATAQAWQVLALEPRSSAAQYVLGLAYEQLGMLDEAITEFENSLATSGNTPLVATALGHVWALAGERDQALGQLQRLVEISERQFVPAFWRSVLLLGLGEREASLTALEQACTEKEVLLAWAAVDPRLAPLRHERRFQAILRAVRG